MENKKRKIAVDADEVLLDFEPALRDYYNHRFGTSLSPNDYVHYDLEKVWGGTKKRAVEIVSDFYGSEEFKKIQPLAGAQEGVRKASIENELSVVTSRPSFIEKATRESLERHFGNVFADIFFNGQYGIHSQGLDKSEYCLRNGIFVLLEDNLDIAKKGAEKGIRVYLFDKKWNQSHEIQKGIIRVGITKNPWEEVLEDLN